MHVSVDLALRGVTAFVPIERLTFLQCFCFSGFSRFITYTATDSCGNQDKVYQDVNFHDAEPPTPKNGTHPKNITLKCGDPFPEAEVITFTDNCFEDIEVTSIEEGPAYDVCVGQKIKRTWRAPKDQVNISS